MSPCENADSQPVEPIPDYETEEQKHTFIDKFKRKPKNKNKKPKDHLQMTITKRDGKQRPPLPFDENISVSKEHYDRLIETEKLQKAQIEELTTRLVNFFVLFIVKVH